MNYRFVRIGVFLFGIFLIISLSHSSVNLWQKANLLDKEEERFAKAKLENEILTEELAKLQTPQYIEKQAREKLGLSRENEMVVVFPGKDQAEVKPSETPLINPKKPVWQQWWKILW